MRTLTHPLWDPPAADAPEALRQAHRLMLQTLMRISNRVPDVLTAPERESGARVMSAALAALANPKIDPEQRLGALSLLQLRMKSVDSATPQRLFLGKSEGRSAVSPAVGNDLLRLSAFDRALEQFVLNTRPGKGLRTDAKVVTLATAMEQLGLFVALLVTRLGHGSIGVIGRVIEALADGRQPLVAGRWVWLDVEMRTTGSPQLRRIHFDPTTFAACLAVIPTVARIPRPKTRLRAGQRSVHYQRVARNAFKSLVASMEALGLAPEVSKLADLCHCEIQRLRMVTVPVLATYAEGGLASASLEPQTWCRLLGYLPPTDSGPDKIEPGAENDAGADPLTGIDPGGASDVDEQYNAGDLDEDGLIADLRQIMDRPRSDWPDAFSALIDRLRAEAPAQQTAFLAVSWLRHLALERRSKGKPLADGSIRHYRGLLVNRLLRALPEQLDHLGTDNLEASYVDVIQSRRSPEQTGRLLAALASFDRYVRAYHLPDLPHVTLPGFGGLSYAISSRILIESEFQKGLTMIRDGTLAVSGRRAEELHGFWVLAYRFGLRRTEILGLQVRDVEARVLRVRINAARKLKTTNAYRVVPLSALSGNERSGIEALCAGRALRDYLFFDVEPTAKLLDSHPVVPKVKTLLHRVTGDNRLHAHNLRHSAATLHLFGVLGVDLHIKSHPYRTEWMQAAFRQARRVDDPLSGHLHRKAGRGNALAMMLGHGSELTTYEHYVHCFDLLLFLSCWRGGYQIAKRGDPARYLFPRRQEAGILQAMLGVTPLTSIKTNDLPALITRIYKKRPTAAERLAERPLQTTLVIDTADATRAAPKRLEESWSLADLMTRPTAVNMPGYPASQADRDSVMGLLNQMEAALPDHRDELVLLLRHWVDLRAGTTDWASMTPDAARKWVKSFKALLPGIRLESQHILIGAGKRRKSQVAAISAASKLNQKKGRYRIRLADTRPKTDGRERLTTRVRSRSQSAITWLILQLTS